MTDSRPSAPGPTGEETSEERAIWLDEEGRRFVVERITRSTASVTSDEEAIGRVPVPSSLPSLAKASRAQLRAIVQAALKRRNLSQWEDEGGAVPGVDPPDN